jgi:hypothetical protein
VSYGVLPKMTLAELTTCDRLRRQAGINLGMLGRRIETPLSTPVIEQA